MMHGVMGALSQSEALEGVAETAEREEQKRIARWWLEKCKGLTLEQMAAAFALGYGRTEKEICEALGIGLHQLKFWREQVEAFRELVGHFQEQWGHDIRDLQKRVIDVLSAHNDPHLQMHAVKLAQGMERIDQQNEGLRLQDGMLQLSHLRFEHEKEVDARMMGIPQRPPVNFNLLIQTGDGQRPKVQQIREQPERPERPTLLAMVEHIDRDDEIPVDADEEDFDEAEESGEDESLGVASTDRADED
jgi:hypothetical protein